MLGVSETVESSLQQQNQSKLMRTEFKRDVNALTTFFYNFTIKNVKCNLDLFIKVYSSSIYNI